ncbi:hypothetical protein EOA28_33480, partial [Mesorhizobium sp. M2A.F.Ca.ET.067.02.1.1]
MIDWREAPLSVLPDISPSWGEIRCHVGFANRQRCRMSGTPKPPISHLEGEMSGRTERWAKELDVS